MNRSSFAALLSLAILPAAVAAEPAKAGQTEVPVGKVVLFSSGVGYFEHDGTVKGESTTELRFKANQINDILKSLVLQDLDKGGKVGTITYPSQDPLEKTLRSFQVDITGNPPLGDLLNQIRGAKVTATLGGEKVTGTILGVEVKTKPAGENEKPIEVRVLNLITGGTIRAIPLEEISGLVIDDKQLQQELDKALTALAQARDQDKKPVTINFKGEGDRHVRIGYVVETPVWKTSYRLVLPADARAKPILQGWAIVENQTDNDWKDVQLSLVSGRPISFVQDLYQPLYVPRPVVQPELYSSLRPQSYDAGIETRLELQRFREAKGDENEKRGADRKLKEMAGREEEATAAAVASPSQRGNLAADGRMESTNQLMDMTASVASVASAAKVGELFQYSVGNVSLPRQRSAMLPIINDPVQVEKVSIYNQGVLARNPLNGARLVNSSGKHLLQGPITVFEDQRYAGDAKIDNVPPGQERLLSYGIDLQMLVNATQNRQENAIQTGRIVKGVLHLSRKLVASQDYIAENKSDKPKTLIVEHPIRQGWKLVDTEKPVETTEKLYRFKGEIAPGRPSKLTVKEEIVQGETLAILSADIGQIEFYSRSGEIPKEVRDVLAEAVKRKLAMVDTQRQIELRQKEMNEIATEQKRIRENMKTVADKGVTSEYYNRLLKKLNEQETHIEKLQREAEELQKTFEGQRKALEDYLSGMNVG